MASYYEQVQEAINRNEKELAHLRDELRGLKSVEKDTPRDSFQRQHAQILYHIEQEQRRLAENKALLDSYHAARDGIAELRERDNDGLDDLRQALATERNPQRRRELLEELERKEAEHAARIGEIEATVQANMANLTDELAEELRQSFLNSDNEYDNATAKEVIADGVEEAPVISGEDATATGTTGSEDGAEAGTTGTGDTSENTDGQEVAVDAKKVSSDEIDENADETSIEVEVEIPSMYDQRRLKLQSDLDAAEDELAEAQFALQESISRLQSIFDEERTRRENEGPFKTEEELDEFTNEYMRQKIEENERFAAARARIARAERQISRIEQRIEEHAMLAEEARAVEVDVNIYEKIRKAVSKKEVLSAIYEQKGLGEVDRRTKEGREQANSVTAEVVESIIEQLKASGIQTGPATQGAVTQDGTVNINQNGGVNINIIDTINIVYGTDIPVKAGPSRTTTLTEAEKDNVERTQKTRIKVRIVPHNGDEQAGKTPGKGPEDMQGAVTGTPTDDTTGTTGAEEQVTNDGPVKVKTLGQVSHYMELAARSYAEKEADLAAAKADLERAKAAGDDERSIAERQRRVDAAQREFDQSLDKLKQRQQEYIEIASTGQYDAVGKEKGRYKLINGTYYGDDKAIPGDVTTLRIRDEDGETRPAFTDASAKREGQIDRKSFERLLRERDKTQAPIPTQTHEPVPTKTQEPVPTKTQGPSPTKTGGGLIPLPTDTFFPVPTKTQEPVPTKTMEPVPTQTQGPVPTKTMEPTPTKAPQRGLMTIMEELTDGLGIKAKDGKRYKASNIKVFKGFKEELCSGNFLYNIVHLVPAIIKLPFNLIRKAAGKIMLRAESKKNIATLKKRLDKLSDEDLMTIYTEYRGNRVIQERFPTILNTLIEERMQKFVLGKVTQINTELEVRYQSAFSAIQQLDAITASLADPDLTPERRKELEAAKADLLKGQAENIAAIRGGYKDANLWLSGGLHGFSEDMKAATTKLSMVGKRFAKDHDLNHDLLKRQAELERAEMQAIADGDDEMALRVFVENELLLSRNTEIKGSLFGRRSTGEKYYTPLAEQLDYRDDPFIRDLFTTIAVTSSAISTIQSVKAAREQAAIIAENNRRMAQNNQTMQQVNQIGQDIADKRGVMMDGMEAQGMQDTLAGANEIERAVLDKTDWGLGTSAYRTADNAGHAYYTTFFDSTKQAYENIAQQYAAGQISQAQAMQLMADLGKQTHQTFSAINTECLNILRPYAAAHPQFDLSGVQGAMEYLQANPSAVELANQAMVDVTNAGDVLASMNLQQLIPLTTLPANIRTVIINGAATAALASNINNSMGAKKHNYGNSVTDMVDDYESGRSASEEGNSKGNSSGK